jgi:tRNA(Arg) A34 adenosine deaminase TadA
MVGLLPVVAGVLPAGYVWAANPSASRPPFDKEQAERFMRRAIELAQQGVEAGDGGPFGTVIVKDGEIVGEGWNRVIATNDPTAHGEVVAIRDATNRIESLASRAASFTPAASRVPMCLGAIYWANIDRVFYGFNVQDAAEVGFDDSFIYEQLAKPLDQRKIPEIQVLGPEQ